MLERHLKETGDGSHTIFIPEWGEHYHSFHGALQESLYVYIQKGLEALEMEKNETVRILEMGFGTGLNALLTYEYAQKTGREVFYTTIEAYPVTAEEAEQLNFTRNPGYEKYDSIFKLMHSCEWNANCNISPLFHFRKLHTKLQDFRPEEQYHLVYWDAFAPDKQPELWSAETFRKIYESLLPGSVLVTYSSKSQVRRNMLEAGFMVEKLPGPPRKREMLRARKA